jgi:hypothetical protein
MDPNFDALTSELNLLRSLGYKFQQQGLIAVQAAESGLNNLANYHKAFSVASGISGAYPAVQQKANEFGISGALATSSLHAANEGLSSAQANIHSFNISALVGVTFTDFAGQNLIQAVIAAAPPDKQDVVAELASSQLDRPSRTSSWIPYWANFAGICLVGEEALGTLCTHPGRTS